MILFAALLAVLAASLAVPGPMRGPWRRAWISEIWHYNAMLRDRGVKHRYVVARVWHHCVAAFRDAWKVRSNMASSLEFRSTMRGPGFVLAMIALLLAVLVVGSRGLGVTRAMLFPKLPNAGDLMLVSETAGLLQEREPVDVALLGYWKAHSTLFTSLAGFQWEGKGGAFASPDLFQVLGGRPNRFLLRRIQVWRPLSNQPKVGVIGRLRPGADPATAETELRDLEIRYRHYQRPVEEATVVPMLTRLRQPLFSYDLMCPFTTLLLLIAAVFGMRLDRKRLGRVRGRYWAYFCAKAVLLPLALTIFIWEFSRATSFSVTGSPTFVAEPFFAWLVILGCGAIVWWCLADQRSRCRACVRKLQFPVRVGLLGAIIFDHAGTELVCCEGHGSLYVPAVSSDYVQSGGWTALDMDDVSSKTVHR